MSTCTSSLPTFPGSSARAMPGASTKVAATTSAEAERAGQGIGAGLLQRSGLQKNFDRAVTRKNGGTHSRTRQLAPGLAGFFVVFRCSSEPRSVVPRRVSSSQRASRDGRVGLAERLRYGLIDAGRERNRARHHVIQQVDAAA